MGLLLSERRPKIHQQLFHRTRSRCPICLQIWRVLPACNNSLILMGATVTSQQCTFCIAEFHAWSANFVIWVVISMVQNAGWALGCHFLWLQDAPECRLGVKLPFSLALLECF